MRFSRREWMCLALSLAVMGCDGSSVEQLRKRELEGSQTHRWLAVHYLHYAAWRQEQGDVAGAEHFAQKGLQAAASAQVVPESPLMLENNEELQLAQARFSQWLADHQPLDEALSMRAANALFSYDCWVDRLRTHDDDHAALCREKFEKSMTISKAKSSSKKAKKSNAKQSKKKKKSNIKQRDKKQIPQAAVQVQDYYRWQVTQSAVISDALRTSLTQIATAMAQDERRIAHLTVTALEGQDESAAQEAALRLARKLREIMMQSHIEKARIKLYGFAQIVRKTPAKSADMKGFRVELSWQP